MSRPKQQKARYDELHAAHDIGPAYTVLLARDYLRDYPEDGPAWLELSIALAELTHYREARRTLAIAVRRCPPEQLHYPFTQLGHLYEYRGDYKRAEQWYRRAVGVAPEDASGHIYLGGNLAVQGRLQEAEEAHRNAVQCKDGCIDEAYLNLGLVLRAQGRLQEALACFTRALELDSEYTAAKEAIRDAERSLDRLDSQGR